MRASALPGLVKLFSDWNATADRTLGDGSGEAIAGDGHQHQITTMRFLCVAIMDTLMVHLGHSQRGTRGKMTSTFAHNLAKAMNESGIRSQAELTRRVNELLEGRTLTRNTVSKYLAGTRHPRGDVLEAISLALGVPATALDPDKGQDMSVLELTQVSTTSGRLKLEKTLPMSTIYRIIALVEAGEQALMEALTDGENHISPG